MNVFFLLESSQAEGFIVSDEELDRTLSQIDFTSFLASQSASPPPLASTPVKKNPGGLAPARGESGGAGGV